MLINRVNISFSLLSVFLFFKVVFFSIFHAFCFLDFFPLRRIATANCRSCRWCSGVPTVATNSNNCKKHCISMQQSLQITEAIRIRAPFSLSLFFLVSFHQFNSFSNRVACRWSTWRKISRLGNRKSRWSLCALCFCTAYWFITWGFFSFLFFFLRFFCRRSCKKRYCQERTFRGNQSMNEQFFLNNRNWFWNIDKHKPVVTSLCQPQVHSLLDFIFFPLWFFLWFHFHFLKVGFTQFWIGSHQHVGLAGFGHSSLMLDGTIDGIVPQGNSCFSKN